MKKLCIGLLVMTLSFVSGICFNAFTEYEKETSYVTKVESEIETSMVFASLED